MVVNRNPDLTRSKLLEAAFEEIYHNGYQGMRVDEILKRTGLKKGAFYHHFPSKLELAYAVLDELIEPEIAASWIAPLSEHKDPVTAILTAVKAVRQSERINMLECGCPLNNLALEMSSLDEGFRQRIDRLYRIWIASIEKVLNAGKPNGYIRKDVDAATVAAYIVASIEGSVSMMKAFRDLKLLERNEEGLRLFLESLRPAN